MTRAQSNRWKGIDLDLPVLFTLIWVVELELTAIVKYVGDDGVATIIVSLVPSVTELTELPRRAKSKTKNH